MTFTRAGQVRPSQLLHTYGSGSLIDLPHLSVLVSGTDRWPTYGQVAPEVVEPRLLGAVRGALGPGIGSLRRPPHLPETPNPFEEWAKVGVPVATFPTWLRCPACDRIGRAGPPLFELQPAAYRPEDVCYRHTNCSRVRGKAPAAVPVRFMLACPAGHLDDFPFTSFVHRGAPCPGAILQLFEPGHSTGADDVRVRCSTCDKSRSMVDAFGEGAAGRLPPCRGRHPHISTQSAEACTAQVRTLLLGSLNAWFSVVMRVLAVPQASAVLDQAVSDHWPRLSEIGSLEMLSYALRNVEALAMLSGLGAADVWRAMEERRAASAPGAAGAAAQHGSGDLLAPEWGHLSAPEPNADYPDFRVRPVAVPTEFAPLIERVVLVERLREVMALIGFTRVDPPEPPEPGEEPVALGPLCGGPPAWVPCAEVRGEGIFIQLREDLVAAWEARVAGDDRTVALQAAHHRWRAQRGHDPRIGWPGPRYLALHTLSHLLMREVALECGYGSASIRERLYARSGEEPMAGILLYTAASDSEGTLGGLVSLGEPESLNRLLRQALAGAELCASEPSCAPRTRSAPSTCLR